MTFLKKMNHKKKYESSLFPLNQLSISILGFNQDRILIFVSRYLIRKIGTKILRPGMPISEVLLRLKSLIHTADAEILLKNIQNNPNWDPSDMQIRYTAGDRHYFSTIASDIIQNRNHKSPITLYYLKKENESPLSSEGHSSHTEIPPYQSEQEGRTYFSERLRLTLSSSQQNHQQSAVIFLSIDHFKSLHLSLSPLEAEKLNTILLERLKRTQNGLEITSHDWENGHYSLIIPSIAGRSELKDRLHHIQSIFRQPFILNKRSLTIHGSMGISLYSYGNGKVERPIHQAELALTVAQRRGGSQFIIYSQDLKEGQFRQHLILRYLPHAYKRGELFLRYQPRIDSDGEFVGVESLLRWHHPELGLIPPQEFIPLAESSGEIIRLGEWVLTETCKQARKWMIQGINITVSVNISPIQIHQPDSCTMIRNILHETALPSHKLELEITETSLLNLMDKTLQSLACLHDLGIRISLDDFGTGYSSLSYLGTFPVDNLKIDQSFIRDLQINPHHRSIVQAIASLAKNFKYKIIAEGVETKEQLKILKEIGCDEFQGYYYHKPLTTNEIENLYFVIYGNQKTSLEYLNPGNQKGYNP